MSPGTVHWTMLSFFCAILLGSILLALPVSAAGGRAVPYTDALFTATSAVCVTGLVTVPTVSAWSVFGQIVILVLIQIGGLGVITCLSSVMMALHRRMGLGDRLLLQDAFNLNSLSGQRKFLKNVLCGTFLVEGAGALLYMPAFIPRFGLKGIWISVFNAVSAFCNAGLDIISENSLCEYRADPLVNLVTCALIVLGGLGYIVWWDVLRMLRVKRRTRMRFFAGLTLQSKLVLSATGLLIFCGTALFLAFEYSNPATLGGLPFGEKLLAAFFQSVTTRTAGFATVPQQDLTNASAWVSSLLMFIGGSPVGTAGGIKTVTIAVLAATAVSSVKGRNAVTLFGRTVPDQAVKKAVAVAGMSFLTLATSTALLSAVFDAPLLDVLYEATSATATVGLSRNLTAFVPFWGKLVLICTMFFGRVGPISLAVAFTVRREIENIIQKPTEPISVG